jgi:hypothetical protein
MQGPSTKLNPRARSEMPTWTLSQIVVHYPRPAETCQCYVREPFHHMRQSDIRRRQRDSHQECKLQIQLRNVSLLEATQAYSSAGANFPDCTESSCSAVPDGRGSDGSLVLHASTHSDTASLAKSALEARGYAPVAVILCEQQLFSIKRITSRKDCGSVYLYVACCTGQAKSRFVGSRCLTPRTGDCPVVRVGLHNNLCDDTDPEMMMAELPGKCLT